MPSDEVEPIQQAAAFHGLATNQAIPPKDRIAAAYQALDLYEAEVDSLAAERDRLQAHILDIDAHATPYGDRMWVEMPRDGVWTEAIVMLLPANRTEQSWWQDLVEPYRDQSPHRLNVEFLRGRLRFIQPGRSDVGPNERPPFGCCLLIWERNDDCQCHREGAAAPGEGTRR